VTTVIASAAVLAGAAFMFVAALGVARMPDLFTRMQAATKATTVGVLLVMSGVAVAHLETSVTIRAVLIAGFFLLTSPVAAHAIARSALVRELPLAPGTLVEDPERRTPHPAEAGPAEPSRATPPQY
jgi:multicomponent Na+:H+ antiporter subunit G